MLDDSAKECERLSALQTLADQPVTIELIEEAIALIRRSNPEEISKSKELENLKLLGQSSIDLAGTGGSGIAGRFNTSTASSFIVAACGVPVIKFGNGAITGTTGSADFLQEAGIASLSTLQFAEEIFGEVGLLFIYAPAVYPQLASLQSLRRRLGRPTVFNLIGPLLNPARPCFRLLGVSSKPAQAILASVLKREGTKRALVVRSDDGLDEISFDYGTTLFEVVNEQISQSRFESGKYCNASKEGSNVESFQKIIAGQDKESIQYNLMLINAGAALMVAQKAKTIDQGIQLAGEALANGSVRKLYQKCVRLYGKLS